jgi:catechol 2,3-dioxygenase-like lactoylglutathione lyase family enzyme
MPPTIECVDHIHVYVADRQAAEKWYADVLNFKRVAELEFWASDDGGPLTIGNPTGTVHIALFQRPTMPCRSVIAFGVSADTFIAWREFLTDVLGQAIEVFDHEVSWSLYFSDPDGNPFEITSHQYAAIASQL